MADKYEHDSVVQEKFTGTTTDRPRFQNLLKKLNRGVALIVYHVSRLGRKTSEVLDVVEQLQERGVEVYVDQLQGIDITSGVGEATYYRSRKVA